MLIRRLRVSGLLSFGPEAVDLPMEPLNVLIGPNGSGKSNLLDIMGLLRAAPKDLAAAILEGGGIHDWIWRGEAPDAPSWIEALVEYPECEQPLRYRIGVRENNQRFEVVEERIENEEPWDSEAHQKPYFYYEYQNGRAFLNHKGARPRQLRMETVDPGQSVLAQRKDEDTYPELFWLGREFGRLRLYREWSFGRNADARLPQKPDLPNDFLSEDGRNLGLILNHLKREPRVKARCLEALSDLYEGVTDFDVSIIGGTVQVVIMEGNLVVPANRISDGTLRYLCLLAALLHPKPPPLICIEEPELGIHPDLLPTIAKFLMDAAERSQLVVTTHSDVLVDALTDRPESVVVCEKIDGQSRLQRLDRKTLAKLLEQYTLGTLWTDGELGGNR